MKNTIKTRNIINSFYIEMYFIDKSFIDNKTLVYIRNLYKNGYITQNEYENLYKTIIMKKIS